MDVKSNVYFALSVSNENKLREYYDLNEKSFTVANTSVELRLKLT